MEKNTRTKNILLIVLLVAVLTLSISYAALSQSLYINSQAIVGGSSTNWVVRFSNVSCVPSGYATLTHDFNTKTNTTVLDGLVTTFRAPGDQIVCDITVENAGTIDATLQTFTLLDNNLSYEDSTGATSAAQSADITAVNNKITYTLVYAAGDIAAGSAPNGEISGTDLINDDLPHVDPTGCGGQGQEACTAPGKTRHLTLTIKYDETATAMPVNDVTVSGFKTVLLYKMM